MMTQPRNTLVSIADTSYYLIVSRCVRRSFLCGIDHTSGRSYEQRRQWIVDICSYAVMSNHYHLVVKFAPEQITYLPDTDIITLWRKRLADLSGL
jgi:REP element-mobilizing transposase RayT